MSRYCFQLQVKPARVDEYRERHAAVWPEMLRALADTGWHNYSLFLRPDGLLIGYLETDDLAAAQAPWTPPRSTPAGRPRWPIFDGPGRPARRGVRSSWTRSSTWRTELAHHRPAPRTDPDDHLADHHRPALEGRRSRSRRGPTATPAPGSRCSPTRASRAPVGEDRRRRDGAPLHRAGAVGRAAHPVGPGRRLRQAGASTPRTSGSPRHDQLQHVPGRRLQARQPDQRRRADPPKAVATTSSASRSWTPPAPAT